MTDNAEPNRWAVLALLSVAQLMVVLDATIVNIALPSAQRALHFSSSDREWIVTAYALAFGSLLLLGGKLGDLFGRKWTFIAGLCGFAIVSAIGGLAQSFGMLVAARALQGMFGALLAPSALGLLTVTFAGSSARAKAFGIFGAIAGGGASVGLLLGGALTQILSWRWCLYVNLVIAVPTAIFALRLLVNHSDPDRAGIDLPGLLAASAGLFALVYGFSNAETQSWTATDTIVALAASPVLLITFVLIERRAEHPLLPLHIVRDRNRGGAYLSILLAAAGIFGVFFFLTYYMQENLGFSPLTTGLAFLPMTAVLVATSTTVQTRVLPRTGAKPLMVTGMALGAIAMHRTRGDRLARLNGVKLAGVRKPHPPRASRRRPRTGVHLRPRDRNGNPRRRYERNRCRLRDGQHLPTDRRLRRSRAPEHAVRQRRRQLCRAPRGSSRTGGRRRGPRLHHGVRVGGRDLRSRLPPRAGRSAFEDQASRVHAQGRARARDLLRTPRRRCGGPHDHPRPAEDRRKPFHEIGERLMTSPRPDRPRRPILRT